MLKLLGGLSILLVTAFWKMDTNKMNPTPSIATRFSSISDHKGSSARNYLDLLKKEYGEGFGTEWLYFPDGDGMLHRINLSMTMKNEMIPGQVLDAMTDEIEFRLYNGNENSYILLNEQGRAVNDAEQDVTTNLMRLHQPLKLVTHGWRSSADKENILSIKDAYLQYEKVTVLTVDWSTTAGSLLYYNVARDTKHIGGRVASFLDALNNEYGVTGDQLHLIGHSLGAHVMGIAASQTKSTVHRVTGLDPARPLFEYPDVYEKLHSSDAEIVDVIHTCAGLLGYDRPLGTVDFYPNEGVAPQPGCDGASSYIEACSHSMSIYFFSESIKDPTMYPAKECESWEDFIENRCSHTGYMGEGVTEDITGTYYLKTKATV